MNLGQFARCVCDGTNLSGPFNLQAERQRLLSATLGSCYDDIFKYVKFHIHIDKLTLFYDG